MFSKEEKILILAGLFHDIGKFRQRCIENCQRHTIESTNFIRDHEDLFRFVLDNENENLDKLIFLIENHHTYSINDDLLKILQDADHLSASERVNAEIDSDNKIVWGYDYLCSLNSKIKLNSEEDTPLRFYKHIPLTKKNYEALIPKEEENSGDFRYKQSDWYNFTDDFKTLMHFYENDDDFTTLINLLLILFEKYMWCIPDFTGSEDTDISLFNHLKDTAGLAIAIYKNKSEEKNNNILKVVAGDIPGIQKYISDVTNTRAARILRGRSVFVQILSRMFASVFLDAFSLPENNLIMLAGGKFYIIIPSVKDYEDKCIEAKKIVDEYLIKTFHYDLKFISADYGFDYTELKKKQITFGQIIEQVEINLLKEKNSIFEERFFHSGNIEDNFVLNKKYISDAESDRVKCSVTENPMFENEMKIIPPFDEDDEEIRVNSQVFKEHKIGSEVLENNVIIEFENDNLTINDNKINHIKDIKNSPINYYRKILLNPDIDEILSIERGQTEVVKRLKNCSFIDVANYCSRNPERKSNIMSFEEMSDKNIGAKYLTLIKGDVDNLGLIMAYGLQSEKEDLKAISRTTTLSNHYKYFFSFFLNGFLKEKDATEKDDLIYTIYAGGDDLVLVCPQSRAVRFIKEFNDIFKDFVCNNKEIHISYSITHFKHSTPVKIVSEFAEDNQKSAKKDDIKCSEIENIIVNNTDCFYDSKNKSSLSLFETIVKNDEIEFLLDKINKLVKWANDGEISSGILRNLLFVSEIYKVYRESECKDTSKLIWHPLLTYNINRNLKRDGRYKSKDPELGEFFDKVLEINKDTEKSKQLERILYPAVCSAIYKLRI